MGKMGDRGNQEIVLFETLIIIDINIEDLISKMEKINKPTSFSLGKGLT